jgi:hypothetical protein
MQGEAVVATHLLQADVAINTTRTRLGHVSLQTTNAYAKAVYRDTRLRGLPG